MNVWAFAHVVAGQYDGIATKALVYGVASTVSVSRVLARQHFPSDVVVGSTFGWLIGGYVLHHRSREHGNLVDVSAVETPMGRGVEVRVNSRAEDSVPLTQRMQADRCWSVVERQADAGSRPSGWVGEGSIFEVHVHAPAEDHAESEDEEEAAGLLDGHDGVEVAAGGEADGGEHDDDEEEGLGALHHDDVAFAVEA